MNRILFEESEIDGDTAVLDGVRAEHVLTVLHGEVGQRLKTGVVNGPVGTGEIVSIARGGEGGARVTVRVSHDQAARAPWVDLILAPPRPRVMKRLLPQLATLGVGRIVLVGAEKVERDFWGATLLKPEIYRPLLIDGLMQAGTTALPSLTCWKSFRRFMREGLAEFTSTWRVVGHPYGVSAVAQAKPDGTRLLLAVGPEGGWTDAEVGLLEENGFARRSLGPRILRSDTAVIALLARLSPEM